MMKDNMYDVVMMETEFAADKLSFLSGIMMAMESGDVVDFDYTEINALGHILNDIKQELKAVNREWQYNPRTIPTDDNNQRARLRILVDQIWLEGDVEDIHQTIKMLHEKELEIRVRQEEQAKKGKDKRRQKEKEV